MAPDENTGRRASPDCRSPSRAANRSRGPRAALGTGLGAPIALVAPAGQGRIARLGAPAALEKEAEAVVALCGGRRNNGSRVCA